DTNPTCAGIEDSRITLGGNPEGLKRTISKLRSVINRYENTFIYIDGPNKEFKPLRKHEHKFEYDRLKHFTDAIEIIITNLGEKRKDMVSSFYGECFKSEFINESEYAVYESYLEPLILNTKNYIVQFYWSLYNIPENDL
ncbi:hypothetical protein COBT_003454, partial [Conglomerata obtusa]